MLKNVADDAERLNSSSMGLLCCCLNAAAVYCCPRRLSLPSSMLTASNHHFSLYFRFTFYFMFSSCCSIFICTVAADYPFDGIPLRMSVVKDGM